VVPLEAAPPVSKGDSSELGATRAKRVAGEHAAAWVESGMVVGLGTGSTAVWAVRRVGQRLAAGELRDIVAVPTSLRTAEDARALGIPLLDDDVPWEIDLTIDGADEVDPNLDLVKGGGGALLREKLVAQATRREIIVVDDSKPSPVLGTRFALPLEVVAFGLATTRQWLNGLSASATVRMGDGGKPFRTDSGNLIVDAGFGPIADPSTIASLLADHAGIVEHGLFIGLVSTLVVGHANGTVDVQHRKTAEAARAERTERES
jgi:ribose 5-phosphate isomerase A